MPNSIKEFPRHPRLMWKGIVYSYSDQPIISYSFLFYQYRQDEMADIERVKILFGKIQYGSPFEAEAVTKYH